MVKMLVLLDVEFNGLELFKNSRDVHRSMIWIYYGFLGKSRLIKNKTLIHTDKSEDGRNHMLNYIVLNKFADKLFPWYITLDHL